MTQPRNVTATFAFPTYTLTVSKAGTGSGTVTSTPSGIDCGNTCSALFNYNAIVTLTAAADSGAVFTGWSGACTGTGTCTLRMSETRDVTATFIAGGTVLTTSAAPGGGGGCFIATAAFGSPMAPQVQLLRAFRNDYLLLSSIGKVLVSGYYTLSPPLAAVIARSESLRTITRILLIPLLGWTVVTMWSPVLGLGLAVLPALAAIWLVGRRFRARYGSGVHLWRE